MNSVHRPDEVRPRYGQEIVARQPFRAYVHSANERKSLLVGRGESLIYLGEVVDEPQFLMVELRRGSSGERVFAKIRRELVNDDLHEMR